MNLENAWQWLIENAPADVLLLITKEVDRLRDCEAALQQTTQLDQDQLLRDISAADEEVIKLRKELDELRTPAMRVILKEMERGNFEILRTDEEKDDG